MRQSLGASAAVVAPGSRIGAPAAVYVPATWCCAGLQHLQRLRNSSTATAIFARLLHANYLIIGAARELLVLTFGRKHPQEIHMNTIRDIMTENVKVVRPDTDLPTIARIMRDEDIGSVPVADNDRLLGMVTDRDIVVRAVADRRCHRAAHGGRRHVTRSSLLSRRRNRRRSAAQHGRHSSFAACRSSNAICDVVGIVSLGDLSREARPAEAGESLKEISSGGPRH